MCPRGYIHVVPIRGGHGFFSFTHLVAPGVHDGFFFSPILYTQGVHRRFLFRSFHSTTYRTGGFIDVAHSSHFLSMFIFPPSSLPPLVCCRSTCGGRTFSKVKPPSPVRLRMPPESPRFIRRLPGARTRRKQGLPSLRLRQDYYVAQATGRTW